MFFQKVQLYDKRKQVLRLLIQNPAIARFFCIFRVHCVTQKMRTTRCKTGIPLLSTVRAQMFTIKRTINLAASVSHAKSF